MAPSSFLVTALLLLAVVGAANSVEDVASFTLLQRIVPDDLLTRVLGVIWGLAMGGVALGSILAPAVVRLVGPSRPRCGRPDSAAACPLAWRRLIAIDRSTPGPTAELTVIDSVPMLTPPRLRRRSIWRPPSPVSVKAGEVVVREGDPGDRFFIVAQGELEIVGERLHRAARAGDHFGEIALLRDVPQPRCEPWRIHSSTRSSGTTSSPPSCRPRTSGRPAMATNGLRVEAEPGLILLAAGTPCTRS